MRILVDLGHPGHVHFYKHAIRHWQKHGDTVLLTGRQKDVMVDLLKHYNLAHHVLNPTAHSAGGLAREFVNHEYQLYHAIQDFRPDVMTAVGGVCIAPVGKLLGIPTVVFTDSEHVKLDRYLTYPLATRVCTPTWFKQKAGSRHIRYNGFQEWAYLHPDYFTPDLNALHELGLNPDTPFVIVRLIAWGAAHDVGHSGFAPDEKRRLLETLNTRARVLLSIEGAVPAALAEYVTPIPPHRLHDLLHYAALYIGEGATMATEAALLGTPAIYVSSLAGTMGNFDTLAQRGLLEAYAHGEDARRRALAWLEDPAQAKVAHRQARDALASELVDVTAWITQTVERAARV